MVIIFLGIIMYVMGASCKYLHDDYKQYPKLFVGYKVSTAMKDKETWEEANNYIYKPCTVSLIFSICFISLSNLMNLKLPSIVYYIVILLIILGPIVSTEIHICKFNKNRGVYN
ncbi:MAG: SdpI family protein [Paraclostridium sp.]